MDLLAIGNLGGYIKNLKLQSQWMLKQQQGAYNAKGKSLEDWLDGTGLQTEEDAFGDRGDDELRKIHQKLEAGGKLTQKEREYLQAHDPEAYRELVNQEREQKAYEQALRRCKSQEEVDRLQINRINASLARVRSVEHDPHIPLSEKLKIAMAEKQRVDRVSASTREFMESGAYAKLPDRAEEVQAVEEGMKIPASPPEETEQAKTPEAPQQPQTSAENPPLDPETRARRARAAYTALEAAEKRPADAMDTRA